LFATLDLRDDYLKAQERWPSQKLKPLCRLMCEHFTRYRKINPDALRKRITKMLKEGEWAKSRDAVHKGEVPQAQSIGDMIFDLKLVARGLAKRAAAVNEQKKSAPRRGKN
jgi:hypothetical protein